MVILIHIGKQDIPSTIESFAPYSFIFSSVNHHLPLYKATQQVIVGHLYQLDQCAEYRIHDVRYINMYNLPYVRTVKPNIENNGSNHKSKVKLIFEHLCDGLVTLENMSTGLNCTLSGNQAVSVKYSPQRLLKDMYIVCLPEVLVSLQQKQVYSLNTSGSFYMEQRDFAYQPA